MWGVFVGAPWAGARPAAARPHARAGRGAAFDRGRGRGRRRTRGPQHADQLAAGRHAADAFEDVLVPDRGQATLQLHRRERARVGRRRRAAAAHARLPPAPPRRRHGQCEVLKLQQLHGLGGVRARRCGGGRRRRRRRRLGRSAARAHKQGAVPGGGVEARAARRGLLARRALQAGARLLQSELPAGRSTGRAPPPRSTLAHPPEAATGGTQQHTHLTR